MNRLVETCKAIALIAVALFFFSAAWVAWDAHRMAVQTTEHLNVILSEVGNAAERVNLASGTLNEAAKEQKDYWAKSSANTVKVTNDVRLTIDKVNRVLIPQVVKSLQDQSSDLHMVAVDASSSIKSLTAESVPLIRAASETAQNAAKASGDPAIAASMASMARSAENVDAATKSVALAADHVEKKVQAMTKPASWSARVGGFLLSLGSQLGQIFSGFVK